MLIECHLTKTFVNVRSQMNRLMCPSSNILFSSPPLTPSFAWRSGNMASDTCRPSLVCWPASWPVGPWQRFWSWSSSSCSSTSPGWRSACLEATHKQRPINWALNIENYTQLCSTYSVKSAFLFSLTICWIRWKLLPWKLKACSNNTLSSTVHSSGNGVKLARSASERSTSCLCHNNMPRAWRNKGDEDRVRQPGTETRQKKEKEKDFILVCSTCSMLYPCFSLAIRMYSSTWKRRERKWMTERHGKEIQDEGKQFRQRWQEEWERSSARDKHRENEQFNQYSLVSILDWRLCC